MKNIILSILVTTTMGMLATACGTPSHTSQNNNGYVNSIYYTADATSSNVQKPTKVKISDTETAALRINTAKAIAGSNNAEAIYVGENNVVDINYDPTKTYAVFDDDESYEARLKKFNSPTYTINIIIDDDFYYNPFWPRANSYYMGLPYYSRWYGPHYYYSWDSWDSWNWWNPWYWGEPYWYAGWGWRGGWYPHYTYHYHPFYYDHYYPGHGWGHRDSRYYGRRDLDGVRGTRNVARVGNSKYDNRSYTKSDDRRIINGTKGNQRGVGVAGGGSSTRRSTENPTLTQIRKGNNGNNGNYSTTNRRGTTTYSTTSDHRDRNTDRNVTRTRATTPTTTRTTMPATPSTPTSTRRSGNSNYRPSGTSSSVRTANDNGRKNNASYSNSRRNSSNSNYNSSRSNSSYNNSSRSSYSSGSSYSSSPAASSSSVGGARTGGSSTRR